MASVTEQIPTMSDRREAEALRAMLAAAQADLAALRAAVVGITAKLDADAGVTDTNYSSLWNPAALTLTP